MSLETTLYVDSSPVNTQTTVAQKHHIDNEDVWRPVNYTSRDWTPAEAGYGETERESNRILTGMQMNKMYTLGTYITVATNHVPYYLHTMHPTSPSSWELISIAPSYYHFSRTLCMSLERWPPVIMAHVIHLLIQTSLKKELTGLLRMKQTFSSTRS